MRCANETGLENLPLPELCRQPGLAGAGAYRPGPAGLLPAPMSGGRGLQLAAQETPLPASAYRRPHDQNWPSPALAPANATGLGRLFCWGPSGGCACGPPPLELAANAATASRFQQLPILLGLLCLPTVLQQRRQASKVSNLLVVAAITADIRYRERSETHSARTDGSLTAQPDVMKNRG